MDAEATEPISIEEFARIDLRVGTIRAAEAHPKADRLLVLQVDIGEPTPRQLVAGIRAAYDPRFLVGRQVVVVANLKPAMLRGVESQGMLLAASDNDGLTVLAPGRRFEPGTKVK
ncbi:MAG: methionine--tRNA ligase subunit beta [bacterium]